MKKREAILNYLTKRRVKRKSEYGKIKIHEKGVEVAQRRKRNPRLAMELKRQRKG